MKDAVIDHWGMYYIAQNIIKDDRTIYKQFNRHYPLPI